MSDDVEGAASLPALAPAVESAPAPAESATATVELEPIAVAEVMEGAAVIEDGTVFLPDLPGAAPPDPDIALDAQIPQIVEVRTPSQNSAGGNFEAAKAMMMSKSKSTPSPGQYRWNDDVNLRKRPVWSMQSPERHHLDLMLPTWTPASRSLQPRAPDPGEYGDQSIVGRNGVFTQPKWSWERYSRRPCMLPDPPKKNRTCVSTQAHSGWQASDEKEQSQLVCFRQGSLSIALRFGNVDSETVR
jgi:hypothetical protein